MNLHVKGYLMLHRLWSLQISAGKSLKQSNFLRNIMLTVILGLAQTLNALAANNDEKAVGTLRIGVMFPTSGPLKKQSEHALKGLKTALKDLKSRDLKLADRIEFVFSDPGKTPGQARQAAEELIKRKRVNVLLGTFSSLLTQEIARIAESLKKPLITPFLTDSSIAKKFRYSITTTLSTTVVGEVLATYVRNQNAQAKVAAIYNSSSFASRQVAQNFKNSWKKLTNSEIFFESIPLDTDDKNKIVRSLQKKSFDYLVLPISWNHAKPLIASLRGRKPTILTSDYWNWDGSKRDINPKWRVYQLSEYSAAEAEKLSPIAISTYDAFMIVASAFKRAQSIRPSPLLRALTSKKEVKGYFGGMVTYEPGITLKTSFISRLTPSGHKPIKQLAAIEQDQNSVSH